MLTYTVEVDAGRTVADAVLRTDQDDRVPATDASVASARIDQTPAPAGRVTRAGKDLQVQLGALSPGRHTVSFTVPVPDSTVGATTSSAQVDSTDRGAVPSGPVTVAVNQADLQVSPAGGTSPAAVSIGTGRTDVIEVLVGNIGGVTTDARLVVTLPPGVTLGPGGVLVTSDTAETTPDCTTTGRTVSCDLGRIAPGTAPLTVDIQITTASTAAGSAGNAEVSVQPAPDAGLESDPANNRLSVPVDLLGTAALTGTITPAAVTVAPGQTVELTVVLTNRGPQAARSVFAAVELDQNAVPLTFVSVRDAAGRSLDASLERRAVPHRGAAAPSAAAAAPVYDVRFWTPADLAAGQSATLTVTLLAHTAGTSTVGLSASSLAGDPNCASAFAICYQAASTVRVVAPVPAPAGGGTDELPDTGSPSGPLLAIGVLLVLVGAGACRAGRRRPS